MHRALGPRAITEYRPWMETATRIFMHELLSEPDQYIGITRKYAGGLTLSVIYGYEVKSKDDKMLLLAEECIDILANRVAAEGGVWA